MNDSDDTRAEEASTRQWRGFLFALPRTAATLCGVIPPNDPQPGAIDSADMLRGESAVEIRHNEHVYVLGVTSHGGLLLFKPTPHDPGNPTSRDFTNLKACPDRFGDTGQDAEFPQLFIRSLVPSCARALKSSKRVWHGEGHKSQLPTTEYCQHPRPADSTSTARMSGEVSANELSTADGGATASTA